MKDVGTRAACCQVEGVTSIDERGQMVLPKEIREKAGIQAGDKMAVITWEKDGQVCCISLLKTTDLAPMVKNILSPMINEWNPDNQEKNNAE